MKQADIESLLMRAEAALAVAVEQTAEPVTYDASCGRYVPVPADRHPGSCTCTLCMLRNEVLRLRQRCTLCDKQRFQHVGVRHAFTLRAKEGV